MKLGKLRAKLDPRTLRLENYLADDIPLPAAADWSYGFEKWDWGTLGNDVFGDCTCAAACHQIDSWLIAHGRGPKTRTEDALAAYAAVTGFDPNDPSTDNGAHMIDVLNYWRKTGIAGHKIDAFAQFKTRLIPHAVDLFGGAYLGLALPATAEGQDVWEVGTDAKGGEDLPWSWGGHAVNAVAYDPQGVTLVTWGVRKRATWGFVYKYCDEAYAILSTLWAPEGPAPGGLDIAALKADLLRVTA